MSSSASAVGGSKTTLCTYFPSKEALFEAVVDDIVDYYGAALQVELPMDEAVLPVLRRFCHVLITTLTSDPLLALYQLVIGEARRLPQIGRASCRARVCQYE